VNPSAENLAKYFFEEVSGGLKALPARTAVKEVILWETDTAYAKYWVTG
jgi:hypothetical protein